MKRNQKRLIQLLIVLLIAFALITIKNRLPQLLPQKPNQPFSSLKKEQIREIFLTKDKTVRLYKKAEFWYVKIDKNEFRADGDRINKIVDSFFDLKKEEIVSKNKNKHKELGIARQKIEIKTNEKSYVIFIGNTTGLAKNYVRLGDENDVFIAGGFEDTFTSEDYRDLLVHLINDESKVTSIQIIFADIKTSLSKKGNDWQIGERTGKKDRVDFFLNDLNTLRGNDILPKDYALPAIEPINIKISEEKREKSIEFYFKDEAHYLARVSTSEFIFQIPAAYVASLKKEDKDFLE